MPRSVSGKGSLFGKPDLLLLCLCKTIPCSTSAAGRQRCWCFTCRCCLSVWKNHPREVLQGGDTSPHPGRAPGTLQKAVLRKRHETVQPAPAHSLWALSTPLCHHQQHRHGCSCKPAPSAELRSGKAQAHGSVRKAPMGLSEAAAAKKSQKQRIEASSSWCCPAGRLSPTVPGQHSHSL